MIRALIAGVNQRVLAIQSLHAGLPLLQVGQVGIVLPKLRTGRAHIGLKLAGITVMQVTHRRGQHDDIAWRLRVSQDQLAHDGPVG
jgi:hypothetical protein